MDISFNIEYNYQKQSEENSKIQTTEDDTYDTAPWYIGNNNIANTLYDLSIV